MHGERAWVRKMSGVLRYTNGIRLRAEYMGSWGGILGSGCRDFLGVSWILDAGGIREGSWGLEVGLFLGLVPIFEGSLSQPPLNPFIFRYQIHSLREAEGFPKRNVVYIIFFLWLIRILRQISSICVGLEF